MLTSEMWSKLTVFSDQAELHGSLALQRTVQIHSHIRIGLLLQTIHGAWNESRKHLIWAVKSLLYLTAFALGSHDLQNEFHCTGRAQR